MYLFEAMRLGSMLRPQAFGTLFDGTGTCAQGAALEAMGWKPTITFEGVWTGIDLSFPLSMTTHPIKQSEGFVSCIIVSLNNVHRWTREQIATWLEPIELAYYKEHPEARPKDVEVGVSMDAPVDASPELVSA